MDIIFVKMRNDGGEIYRSYFDYWNLVRLSEFKTCELNEVDRESDNTYILSPVNGNTIAFVSAPHKCRFICWQLERPNNMTMHVPDGIEEMWFSEEGVANSHPRIKQVQVGGHADFGEEPETPVYDFALMAYVYGKRERQLIELRNDYKFCTSGNSWDLELRNTELRRSRWGLCLHQDTEPCIEPLRFVLFACYKLPLVVEHSRTYYPYEVVELYPLETFRQRMEEADLGGMVERNYKKVTSELTFRNCVEDALR